MYEIIRMHNRPWTERELLLFAILAIVLTVVLVRLVKAKKIVLSQAAAGELLFVFLMMVLASTVFTRTSNGVHSYKLIPFWSWRKVVSGDAELLEEILLNVILFIPAGFLLPFVFHKKICFNKVFLAGAFFSFMIECSQLVLCRGLFEWDDMIGNGIGAMIGGVLSNQLIRKIRF